MSGLDLQRFGLAATLPDGGSPLSPAGPPVEPLRGSAADQELSSSLEWLIRVRWMAAAGLLLATLAASAAGLAVPRGPLVLVGLGILAYNVVFAYARGLLPGDPRRSLVARQWFARVQIGADWVATAALIHYTGGIESPAILFYLFHITIASLLLPHDRGFLYVGLAPVLVGGVAVAEYAGWLPHVPFVGTASAAYARAGHVAAVLALFAGSAYAMAVCSMSVSRRLRRREHEVAGLYESVRLTTLSLDLPLVLERLTQAVVAALGCKAASIRLLDRAGRVEMVASHGLSDAYQGKAPMDLGKALVDREVLTGKVVLVADASTDPRVYHPQAVVEEGIRSMLCAPLVGKRGAIGVLRAYGGEGHAFTGDDERFLAAIASHGAVAIENADAYEGLKALDREKSRFVRMVTHELRSPVQVTQNLMAVLQGGYTGALNERQLDLVGRARHRVALLENLVDDLLDLAAGRTDVRPDRPDLGLVGLGEVAGRVCDRFGPACRAKGLALRLRTAPEPLHVWSDRATIDRIVDNLVGNAVKYTPTGGVDVDLAREDDFARLAVTDTGIGIPACEQARLFEEFFRASNARQVEEHGTGLGLAIVRDLVTACGGRISIESTEGQGTSVTVLLPLARQAAPAS